MKIDIFNNKGIEIKSIDQWPKPMRSNQWKDGRSAMLLAEYVLNQRNGQDFHDLIKSVLRDCGIESQNFECYAEAPKGLGDGFGRGNRHHDLLMTGKNCVIGIEAKVSESFDQDSIEKKLNEKEDTKRKRAEKLINFLVPEERRGNQNCLHLPYQLFTATRSTMSWAEKNNMTDSIFLVLVFTGDVLKERDYDDKCRKNDEAFNTFLDCIKEENEIRGQINRKLKDKGNTINCWIKKVEVVVTKTFKIDKTSQR